MLTIKNLSIYNNKDIRTIIKDFSFVLNPEDKVAIIGEEGNGKSTLLKAVAGSLLVENYFEISGEIGKKGERIGYLPQIVEGDKLKMSPKELLDFNIKDEDFDYNLFYKLLADFNLSEEIFFKDINLENISGGEKIKAQLLIIMMKEPTLLLLDEPTNDLDLEALEWMQSFINKSTIPIMYVSHDESLLEKTANRIVFIEQTMRKKEPKISIYNLGYKDFFELRQGQISIQEQRSKKEHEEFNKKMDRYSRIYNKVENALSNVSRSSPGEGKNLKDKMHTVKSMGKRFEKEKENLTKMPDYEEAIFFDFMYATDIHNSKTILDFYLDSLKVGEKVLSKDIGLKLIGPQKIAIVGKNGSGKTTLVKEILKDLKDLKVNVAYMPQDYSANLDFSLTPIEFLKRDFSKEEETRLRTYLGSMKFTFEEMDHKISQLSGGQRAKLYFISMIIDRAEVMVLDEPTRNLSPLSGPIIRKALKNFGGAIISVSHDRKYLEEVVDEIYLLNKNGLKKISFEEYYKKIKN